MEETIQGQILFAEIWHFMYRFSPSKGVKAIQEAFNFRELKKCLREKLFIEIGL